MSKFIEATVLQYRDAANLVGWDAWNELRWNVQADGLVDYSPYAIQEYRRWLDARYGGLDGLNRAWKRRYPSWDDVWPGKMPDRPYTDMIAFQHFLTWRSVQHAWKRYDLIKSLDPKRPVTVHGGQPTVLHGSDRYPTATALHRGNDWFFAERTDGIGCSSFPLWGGREMDAEGFSNRLLFLASAAQGKRIWLSELQGGRSNIGFEVHQSVDAASQQRWIWTGLASGADTILFWCWRDEVFGRESNGFGMAGNDGLAGERLAAMKKTADVLAAHGSAIEEFEPESPEVGILFSPQAYYTYWSQYGTASTPLEGIQGYARALIRRSIPYRIIEEEHLAQLDGIKILFMPRAIVLDQEVSDALVRFVQNGGVIVCESEVGAFSSAGIYRYPEERPFARATQLQEVGRRILHTDVIECELEGRSFQVHATDMRTPYLRDGEERDCVTVAYGSGRFVFVGSFIGDAYLRCANADDGCAYSDGFEDFVQEATRRAGVEPPVEAVDADGDFVDVRWGRSGDGNLLFVFLPPGKQSAKIAIRDAGAAGRASSGVEELISGSRLQTNGDGSITVERGEWGIALLSI
jgi:beta-galactosidase